MLKFNDTVGVVVKDVAPDSDFVLIYAAEKIVVPKDPEVSLYVGDKVFFDYYNGFVTGIDSVANHPFPLCGISLENVDDGTEIMIDLMPQ
jgi:hypothetical protein